MIVITGTEIGNNNVSLGRGERYGELGDHGKEKTELNLSLVLPNEKFVF